MWPLVSRSRFYGDRLFTFGAKRVVGAWWPAGWLCRARAHTHTSAHSSQGVWRLYDNVLGALEAREFLERVFDSKTIIMELGPEFVEIPPSSFSFVLPERGVACGRRR